MFLSKNLKMKTTHKISTSPSLKVHVYRPKVGGIRSIPAGGDFFHY